MAYTVPLHQGTAPLANKNKDISLLNVVIFENYALH